MDKEKLKQNESKKIHKGKRDERNRGGKLETCLENTKQIHF